MNPVLWFGDRKLEKVPPHFVRCTTPVNSNIEFWVLTKTYGRYSIITVSNDDHLSLFSDIEIIYFEDPKEAILYELRWAGSK